MDSILEEVSRRVAPRRGDIRYARRCWQLPFDVTTAKLVGTAKGELEKLRSIITEIPRLQYICLDVANGYSEHFVEFVKLVRKEFPKHTIMAGNVVTGEMVEELILSGADIIKVDYFHSVAF